jgi:ribosome-associated toxin RatA of RatAB toxin-antitoxin module
MADATHEEIVVAASPSMCFGVAADFEEYPEWASDVKEVDVVERDASGRGSRVAYRASALGRTIRYVLDYDWSEAPAAFSWTLVEGDMVRAIDGRYGFRPEGDGTLVTYDLSIDLAVPLPGLVKRRAAGLITNAALEDLRRAAEGCAS